MAAAANRIGRVMDCVTANGVRVVTAITLALWVFASGPAMAQTADTLAAADRLIAVQKPTEVMKDMATNVAARIPGATDQQKQAFVAEMTNPGFMARYQDQMRTVMAKHLTVEEMNALAEFYSKPVAQSAMKKMGATTAEMMTFLQSEIPAMVGRIMKTP
jgi:hypothetical protein